jgi:hypothetical protein
VAEVLLARSREYELNAPAADERAQAGDRAGHIAAQCFFTIALALRENSRTYSSSGRPGRSKRRARTRARQDVVADVGNGRETQSSRSSGCSRLTASGRSCIAGTAVCGRPPGWRNPQSGRSTHRLCWTRISDLGIKSPARTYTIPRVVDVSAATRRGRSRPARRRASAAVRRARRRPKCHCLW